MALTAKQNNAERIIKDLFRRNGIPLSHPEFSAFLDQAYAISNNQLGSDNILMRAFEPKVLELAELIKQEKFDEVERVKAEEKALFMASERTLSPVRLNNSRMLMAYPWFSPDQKVRKGFFEYTSPDGSATLGVHPSPKYGAAKVWDGDILMYALSKATKAYLATKQFPRKVEFSAYEYLKQSGKNDSGKNRQDLKERLKRLAFTQYEFTHINAKTKKEGGGRSFHLCGIEWGNDNDERLETIGVYFSDELFEYFATKNDLLTLKDNLLLESWKEDRSGIRKRLLMLVGVHLGEQRLWRVGLKTLQGMCGHVAPLKEFKRNLISLIPSLPWTIYIEENKNREQIVHFAAKDT
jgi:hypothetical protein